MGEKSADSHMAWEFEQVNCLFCSAGVCWHYSWFEMIASVLGKHKRIFAFSGTSVGFVNNPL